MPTFPTDKSRGHKGHWLAVAGASAQVMALLMMAKATADLVYSVMRVESHPERGAMGNSFFGEDVWVGAFGMATTLVTLSLITVGIAVPGSFLIFVSIYSRGYRAVWLYRLLIASGTIYLAVFPLGTILGAVLLVVASSRLRELHPPPPPEPPILEA